MESMKSFTWGHERVQFTEERHMRLTGPTTFQLESVFRFPVSVGKDHARMILDEMGLNPDGGEASDGNGLRVFYGPLKFRKNGKSITAKLHLKGVQR